MKESALHHLLGQVKKNEITVNDAVQKLKQGPFNSTESDFFVPDHHRVLRMGLGEVVYAETKKTDHLLKIAEKFNENKEPALFTRLKKKQMKAMLDKYPEARYNKDGRSLILNAPDEKHADSNEPFVAIVAAGTSDLPVIEQACEVCVAMNTAYERIVDVGVAGLHRILFKVEILQKASAVIVVAGMEGALPSVVGGLVDCPVFAVPTSVGYGASFKGLSALLAMLNSCAPGVMVSNIDNGFSAAFAACQVIRMIKKGTGAV